VVGGGAGLIRAAKNATKTIPIVMIGVGADPIEAGLVETLARPGGNVTGVTNLAGELGGKRLELLKEAVPKMTRVAVLYNPTNLASTPEVKEVLPAVARALGLTVRSWEVRAADGFEKVFAALNKERPDGLYVPPGGRLMFANGKRIAGFALKSRVPSMYNNREAVNDGGLMWYGADQDRSYRLGFYPRFSICHPHPRSSILVSIDRVVAHREVRPLAGARAFRLSSRPSPALSLRLK
jgi:putative tryptophan/tyrosine transport system substrate-binding protein